MRKQRGRNIEGVKLLGKQVRTDAESQGQEWRTGKQTKGKKAECAGK